MRDDHAERDFVARQYRCSANLAARQRIYAFDTTKTKWQHWVFDQMHLPFDARVLELGCGNGMLWRENLLRIPRGWQITLSDLSDGMLCDARAGLAEHAIRFAFARLDAQAIPLPDRSVDAVVANHMLYHVPDRPRAYREIARVLIPGGHLFAATNGGRLHTREIRRLIDEVVPPRQGERYAGFSGFSLDGARAELQRFFDDVELLRLRGELRVPEAQVILDYVRSLDLPKAPSTADARAIEAAVRREIDAHGAFRVTTETGLCRARAR